MQRAASRGPWQTPITSPSPPPLYRAFGAEDCPASTASGPEVCRERSTDAANFAFDTTHAGSPCSVAPTSARARPVSTCQVSMHRQECTSTAQSCNSLCRLPSASSGANPTQWSRARSVCLSPEERIAMSSAGLVGLPPEGEPQWKCCH